MFRKFPQLKCEDAAHRKQFCCHCGRDVVLKAPAGTVDCCGALLCWAVRQPLSSSSAKGAAAGAGAFPGTAVIPRPF